LPRRHIPCAAGALAAVLLAAASPAAAQTAPPQPLRGSITPQAAQQQDDQADEASPPAAPSSTGQQPANAGDASSGAGSASDTSTQALGGIGDDEFRENEVTGVPAIDEAAGEVEPVPGITELGLTTVPGETRQQAVPGTGDLVRHRALLPRRHDLDPYVPIGFKLGSFLLFTEAQVGTILTDNVLETENDTHPDQALEVAPDIRLESNWARHFFSAQFIGDRSWYNDFAVMDDRTYQAILRGRIDVTRRSHLELEAEKSLTQEGRNSVSLTDIGGEQTDLNEEHLSAAVDHTFNRLNLRLTGTTANYDYDQATDIDLTGPLPFADIRDYREDELKLRSTWTFRPQLATIVEGAVNQRDYKQPINEAGFRKGSSGFSMLTGLRFDNPRRLTGEIGIGWGEQQSIDDRLSPVQGFLIDADVIWMPTPMTKLEFLARTEIDETSFEDSAGAIDHFFELSLQHAFWRYFVLGGYVSYEKANYVDDPLVDQRVKEGLTAEYYFNPNFSVYSRYEHTDFISTSEENNFVENEVRVGVRIRK
jgi:hypothetical protein